MYILFFILKASYITEFNVKIMSDSDLESGGEGGGGRPGFDVRFEVIPASRGGNARCVVIDGYHFSKDKLNRYKCSKARGHKCRARAHLDIDPRRVPEIGETGYCKLLNAHSCGEAPGKRATFKKQLRKRMLDRATEELTLNPSTIYNEEREKFLAEYQGHPDSRLVHDMLSDLSKDAMKKSMWRARQEAIPRVPRNARDALNSILASEKYSLLYKGEVQVGEELAFITFCDEMLPYVGQFTECFTDATFSTCGKDCFYQKQTFFGKVEVPGKLPGYMPLFHIFMTSKSQSLYTAVFQKLRDLAPGFRPTIIMADFERALRSALTECFPGARLAGCHFHYCNALYKNTCSRGLQVSYRQDKDLQHFMKEFNALGLLPATEIEGGFLGLQARIGEFPDFEEPLADFCRYHERFWINQIGPEGFSVFGLQDRTNNVMESFHALLKHVLGAKAPWWPIMEFLRNSFVLWKVDFDAMRKGNLSRDPGSKRRRARQKLIKRFQTQLQEGVITVAQFLDKAA